MEKKSVGVIALGIIFLVLGGVFIYGDTRGTVDYYQTFHKLNFGYLVNIVRAIGLLFSGLGVLLFRAWGRYLVIILSSITLGYCIGGFTLYLSPCSQRWGDQLFSLPIYADFFANIIIIYFFTRPKVRKQFK